MATEITMPKLSDTMTEGQIGAWRKSVGERIERGDIIAEVETDKATMDLEAFTSGILLEQRVQAGELVPVGSVIGLIGEPAEIVPQSLQPNVTPIPAPPSAEASPVSPVQTQTPPVAVVERSTAHGVEAAPVVRRRAAELGLDLTLVKGSGPEGRIMLEDLERHAPSLFQGRPDTRSQPPPGETPATIKPSEATPLSRMRRAIARNTLTAWQSIPHFYLTREIEMDQAEQIVRGLKGDGVSVSLNAMILAAAATTLTAFPALNSGYGDEGNINYPAVNLAFAVALDDGLQMPVIKGADAKGVRELTADSSRLAERARQGGLTVDEISGGSFSVSNLGMYGVDTLASIIMPGQAAILGVGSVAERPLARNGAVGIARLMTVTLSCDHRIIDGATAAAFLNEFKRLLEHPAELQA
ncbi:MAG: dihydrolipoamide acetyltransferase family protein [Desulfuromonadaceae bacterium]